MVAPAGRGTLVPASTAVPAAPPPLKRRDRAYLARVAADVRGHLTSAAADMLAAGRVLLQASRRVGRDQITRWLLSGAAGVKRATAYRLMAVAKVFEGVPREVLGNIPRVSLYALAQDGVPQGVREYVLELAADGTRVTEAETLQLIEEHRKPSVPAKGYRGPAADPRAQVDPAAVHAADNWLALLVTLRPGVTLHVACTEDSENGDKAVSVTMLAPGQRPRTVVRPTLEEAVTEIGGLKRLKVCRACLEKKPLEDFSRLKDSKDGRNRSCLACERERVANADAEARAESRAKRTVIGDRGFGE